MTLALKDLRSEFRPMFKLAWPVVLSEIGWMMMGVVDTIMVGRVSPEAIGGVSIGSVLHFTVAVFGMGVLLGLDTLVSQAFGGAPLGRVPCLAVAWRLSQRWSAGSVDIPPPAVLPVSSCLGHPSCGLARNHPLLQGARFGVCCRCCCFVHSAAICRP